MDMGTIHGIYTLVFMLAFISLGVWVYLPRNRKSAEDAASLPFSDERESGTAADESRRQD